MSKGINGGGTVVVASAEKPATIGQNNSEPLVRTPRITRIMLQFEARLDSWFALHLLKSEGEKKYPGVRNARIECCGSGTFSPDGKTWRDHLKNGTLQIGVGGGPFDEHPSPDFGDRKAEKLSATLLVARDLGLEKHPVYKRLVKGITEGDLNIGKDFDTWARTIKAMHRAGRSMEFVMEWIFDAFEATLDCQQIFLAAQQQIKDAKAYFVTGSDRVILCVDSDNPEILSAARSLKKDKLAFLIVARTSGNVQVFGNAQSGSGVEMGNIPAAIRCEELLVRGRGREVEALRPTLNQPGTHPEVRWWHWQNDLFMNGSETARDTPPTAISRARIREIVVQHSFYVPPDSFLVPPVAPATPVVPEVTAQ